MGKGKRQKLSRVLLFNEVIQHYVLKTQNFIPALPPPFQVCVLLLTDVHFTHT